MSTPTFTLAGTAGQPAWNPGAALYIREPDGTYYHLSPGQLAHIEQTQPGVRIYTTPTQTAASGAPGAPATSGSDQSANLSAKAIITQTLAQYGLGSLADWAWQAYLNSGSIDYVMTQLPQQKAFQARFPAYQQLAQEGHGLTVSQYLEYENTVLGAAHAAGFPPGVVDEDTITSLLLGHVSSGEAVQRVQDAVKATYQLDTNSQSYLQARELGLGHGDLAAVWFDPKKALPVLENKLAAAQIGGAAAGAGIGLDTNIADQLAKRGVTPGQAQQGFGNLANDQQLFHALPGQNGTNMAQGAQVGAEFGSDAGAALALQTARAGRVAAFKAGGGFTASNQGLVGAGANRGA